MCFGGSFPDPESMAIVSLAKNSPSFDLKELKAGDYLEVHTATEHVYSITLSEPANGFAKVSSDNPRFHTNGDCLILGSQLGKCPVFTHKIIVGFHLVIIAANDSGQWHTSKIVSVRLNPSEDSR